MIFCALGCKCASGSSAARIGKNGFSSSACFSAIKSMKAFTVNIEAQLRVPIPWYSIEKEFPTLSPKWIEKCLERSRIFLGKGVISVLPVPWNDWFRLSKCFFNPWSSVLLLTAFSFTSFINASKVLISFLS